MERRELLSALPAIAVAAMVPSHTNATQGNSALAAVVHQLEAYQGWESSNVVAAKAFAAHQIRMALGMGPGDVENAQSHVEFQGSAFERYEQTFTCERDRAEGIRYSIHPQERALAI